MERLAQCPADPIGLRDDLTDDSVRLLQRTEAPITAQPGFVCLDFDTFVMDNSGTKLVLSAVEGKEAVSRTPYQVRGRLYQSVDGYTPIAAYLGNEGGCLGLELRLGSQHSALESHYFLERVLPRARALAATEQAVLSRSDSGFDSARQLFLQDDEKWAWAEQGRRFEYRVKWNPRQQRMEDWMTRADEAKAWVEARPGKRVAVLDLTAERAWQKQKRDFRRVARLIERTLDQHGQALLLPDVQLEGWWTRLDETPESVIERYCAHATHEQFHSDPFAGSEWGRRQAPAGAALRMSADQFKTDFDLERLPSGKFDCNDLIGQCALLAYHCLRLIGQLGLTGELSKVAPSGQTPAHPDGPAGNHVPRRAVHPQGAATDPGRRATARPSERLPESKCIS